MEPSLGDALRYLEEKVAADPDNISLRQELLRWQSRALRDDQNDELASAWTLNVEVLRALNPRDPTVLEILAPALDPGYHPPLPPDSEAVAALEAAELAWADDRWDDAAGELRRALLAAPDSPAVHLRLGELLTVDGRPDQALGHLRFALERAPDSARVWAGCAAALRALRRWPEAFDHAVEALVQNPLCAPAETLLAELGPPLRYRWRRVPLAAQVWPLIGSDGSCLKMARRGAPWAARLAWSRWATACARACAELPLGRVPLAGLPHHLESLLEPHEQLLATWRRRRRLRLPWRRRRQAERDLDWLAAVDDDGGLEAYLVFAYLHPDQRAVWEQWRRRGAAALERLLRIHLPARETAP